LLTLPHRFWSIGPSLALTVFDGGARSAQKAQAIATYNKNVATYRQTVLAAFQQVEDNLIALRILEEEGEAQQAAARLAAEAWTLTDNQYKSGTVSYLNVVTAQATALSTAKSSLDITSRRLVASAALLTALGGDWRTPESPSSAPH
jgi:outer membrane protein TolC